MSNTVNIHGKLAFVYLQNGRCAVIDAEDVDKVKGLHWYAHKTAGGFYAASRGTTGSRSLVYMHRVINETGPRKHTDHRNGDTLDNRKENLRSATHAQNMQNRRSRNVLGKCVYKHGNGYAMRLRGESGELFLGGFMTAKHAEKAYETLSSLVRGEFAWKNPMARFWSQISVDEQTVEQ